ncbi:MAG: ribonuclease III [Nevskiales bacterium]
MANLENLQRKLGYQFQAPSLLVTALTHRSAGPAHNERLEFLGDAVLNFLIAEAVYQQRPQAHEGDLSRLRAHLVREAGVAGVARALDLGEHLIVGAGETGSGSHRRQSLLADVMEAVLGAVLLDGGVESARQVTLSLYADALATLPEAESLKDAKTRLQEYVQARELPLPQYESVSSAGPQHDQHFVIRCRLTQPPLEREGAGSSRRSAEQAAAEAVLAVLDRA